MNSLEYTRKIVQHAKNVWPAVCATRMHRAASETCAGNERPVRGDNRTGQAIWALGVDGRSRRIQPMGRDYRSHINKSQHPRRTFKTAGDFFNFLFGTIAGKSLRSGYFAAFAADLSDAIDGGASFSALLTEALSADGSSAGVFSPAGLPETEASGTAGAAVAAVTAAKASASPAPN